MHRPSIFIAAASLLVLAACAGKRDVTVIPIPPTSAWPSTQSTDGGSFEVTVAPTEGAEIERNEHFSLDVTLSAKEGEAGDIAVIVDADMPAHQHGMNTKPEITKIAPLRHRVDGMLFHMGGDWVITVEVTRGDETEQASFPVSVE